MYQFNAYKDRLIVSHGDEIIRIEPWGPNGVRVRATRNPDFRQDWTSALLPQTERQARIEAGENGGSLQHGELKVLVTAAGELIFINAASGQELLKEKAVHPLTKVPSRVYKPLEGGLFHLGCCFEAYEDEHFYGLGQHQHGLLDQKGCVIELVQRNAEVSIPFLFSSRGYGFLWNNPAIGRVELAQNATRWVVEAAPQVDYWVTTGNDPAEIMSNYAGVTGHVPQLPEWAAGFWQSKLRYASQEELVSVAEEYKKRNLPLSVIVIDFFHWTRQGDWKFNPEYWPDPAGMVERLKELGIRTMVSVWPSVNRLSENYDEMAGQGYIVLKKSGTPAQTYFIDNQAEAGIYIHYYDPTHPGAREFIWEKVKKGYYQNGIKVFWLDACEPELVPLDPENLRFHIGDGLAVANAYPFYHASGFFDGMQSLGEQDIFFLCRSAWAGSQRFGAAVWSGDIQSTFEALRAQIAAGLNMGLSGIPWWTHDIGGFRGGDPKDPAFRELIVRWFQFGVFSPLFRLHGHRLPNTDDFGGADNEVWSFGDEAYDILQDYLFLRERLRPYIMEQMQAAHETGSPVMRPLFYDYPEDPACYRIRDQYMFGPDLLVAPVVEAGARKRSVYLPAGSSWKNAWTQQMHPGGQQVEVDAPLECIPLFLREDADLPIKSTRA